MRYEFDWEPDKAASNLTKHDVSFEEAMTIFADPLSLSVPDRGPWMGEERWVTIGMTQFDRLLLVVHTHVEISDDSVYIRVISARKPTRREIHDYEDNSNV